MKNITPEMQQQFHAQGFLRIPGFYDVEQDILPIQKGIYDILQILLKAQGMQDLCTDFDAAHFDAGYQALIAKDRQLGGIVYESVKQIPAFVRLTAHPGYSNLLQNLRPGSLPGIASKGCGIRIDNPGETQYQAPWHQDYLAQLKSPDGLVFWSPLIAVTPEMGPVEFCQGSHRQGAIPVYSERTTGQTGAYALRLQAEAQHLSQYAKIAPLSQVGDLIIIDFLTIHRSGTNRSNRSRWSLQIRYFNYQHPFGIRTGWPGLFGEGKHLKDYCPELIASPE